MARIVDGGTNHLGAITIKLVLADIDYIIFTSISGLNDTANIGYCMAIAYDSQTVQVGQWASVACTEDYLPFVCKKLAYGTPTAATTTVSQGKFCKTMVLIRSYINDCFLHL